MATVDNLRKRVERLRQQRDASGLVEVVFLYDDDFCPLGDDEQTRRLAAARAKVGPAGTVIPVRLVEEWRHAQPAQFATAS